MQKLRENRLLNEEDTQWYYLSSKGSPQIYTKYLAGSVSVIGGEQGKSTRHGFKYSFFEGE